MTYKKKRKYKKKKIKSEKICSGFVPEVYTTEIVSDDEAVASLVCGMLPSEMSDKIKDYFKTCGHKKMEDIDGVKMKDGFGNQRYELVPPTICGLALALGFATKQEMWEYMSQDGQLNRLVKRAHLMVEEFSERMITAGRGMAGNVFKLKNLGWKDKFEVELSKAPELHFDKEDINL